MANAKSMVTEVLATLPDDASYDEILRELAFQRMVERGLDDARQGRVISHDDIKRQAAQWRK